MNRPSVWLLVPLLLAVPLACDEPSSPPPSAAPPPRHPTPEADAGAAVEESGPDQADSDSDEAVADAVVEPAPPVGGPHCDEIASRQQCVDYSEHRGAEPPRCFGEVELSEGPCPEAEQLASCRLEATGVVLRYYEGKTVEAARETCATIYGEFTPRK